MREGRSSGKTPWCAGCNTETSAKYLNTQFPDGDYSILRLQHHLRRLDYDAAELESGAWEIDPTDGDMIMALIKEEFQAAIGHFRRVQRRFGEACLAWHFALGHQNQEGLWVELQVLLRHGAATDLVLKELTGGTRKAALFEPDTAIRYHYPKSEREQLRRDWAGLLKCALLRLDDDVLFGTMFFALKGKQLSMAYGALRQALKQGREETRQQREEAKRCPVLNAGGKLCNQKLTFFLDPEDKQPVNPLVYHQCRQRLGTGPPRA